MANVNSKQDDNQVFSVIALTGVAGTATTVPLVADANGNLMVNIAAGESINIGTITLGTITAVASIGNVVGGTLGVVSSVANLAAGTLTAIPNIPGGTVGVVSSVTNLAAGTITSVGNVAGGTIREDARPAQNILTYGTAFGGTAAAYGTLIGAPGVGTSIWINDVSIVNTAGTITCGVTWGSAAVGTAVMVMGQFAPNGGIQKSFPKAVNGGGTNTSLMAYVGGAGTADFVVSYFISV